MSDSLDYSKPGFPVSRTLLKLISIELVMPYNHLILCCYLFFFFLLLPFIKCLLDKNTYTYIHIYIYRMWLNTKIWFFSVMWKTCSNFWIVVLFAHLFLRIIYVCRLLLSLYLSVYKSTCWVWPSGVGNKIYHLHFHK